MLSLEINNDGFSFSVEIEGKYVDFQDWESTDDCIYYFPLATLVDNGNASLTGAKCIVPFANIYFLDNDERLLLGVPSEYNKAMRLTSDGMLGDDTLMYKIEYLTHIPDGKLLKFERLGNVLLSQEQNYLLKESQYLLSEEVSRFNKLPLEQKNINNNLRSFAKIKALALEAGCQLESYLENENVEAPEKVKMTLGYDQGAYTLKPVLTNDEENRFAKTFDKMRRMLDVYPISNADGERTRVVLSKEQKEMLSPLKERNCKFSNREDILRIIERPTEYFNPDEFDLSELYSDRVIEIGIYHPTFFPFISPYQSRWIPGATVSTPENGTAEIYIDSYDELEELENAIQKAENENNPIVEYHNSKIAIEDARLLADIARKQLKNPEYPIDGVEKKKPEVLIIEGNEEELGYKTETKNIEKADKFTLYKNEYLKDKYSLKEHQEEGVAWLQHLYANDASGCLMADDMGLGKTLQILYFIDWHARNHPNHKPYLIVAPVTLLENWEQEYNRFFDCPMKIKRLSSKDVPRKLNKEIVKSMQNEDIILTNYESLRVSQLNFCAVEFEIVAIDEAQRIKTPGTMITNATKALKSKFKIAMTGTPVENSLLDLWCIMDFVVPGLLGNAKDFAAKYQHPLKNSDTDVQALGNEVHKRLGQYFMRRLKKDVAKDLPQKYENKVQQNMPDIQVKVYRDVVNAYISGAERKILKTILQIREVSEHPYLFSGTLSNYASSELIRTAARLQATLPIVDKIREKEEKVIVFAERKESQKMLQRVFHEKYGIVAKIINGDTPTQASRYSGKQSRQTSIDYFQKQHGFNIIIMSPVAAGMGLNVTAANHVIHFSRHWNPAKENQATDRAYRIGQTKDVYVYYPMAISDSFTSFDITLDELLSRKTALATSTIFPTERVEVTQEELGRMLFGELKIS